MGSARQSNGVVRPAAQAGLFPESITKEIRGELLAITGHELAADDPAIVFVELNQLLILKIADAVVASWRAEAAAVAAQLDKMKAEMLNAARADLLFYRDQARDAMALDASLAEGNAARIVKRIEVSLRDHRMFWILLTAGWCASLLLVYLVAKNA